MFVDCLPGSLPLLEAVYSKLFLPGVKTPLPAGTAAGLATTPETVIWQLVRFFAGQEDQLHQVGQQIRLIGYKYA